MHLQVCSFAHAVDPGLVALTLVLVLMLVLVLVLVRVLELLTLVLVPVLCCFAGVCSSYRRFYHLPFSHCKFSRQFTLWLSLHHFRFLSPGWGASLTFLFTRKVPLWHSGCNNRFASLSVWVSCSLSRPRLGATVSAPFQKSAAALVSINWTSAALGRN